MGKIFYFVKEALRGFYQAKLMTFVAIVTIAVTLFVLGCVTTGYLSIRRWLDAALEKPSLSVFVTDAAYENTQTLDGLMQRIGSCDGVAGVRLVGKDSAWHRFEELYGPEMLDAVDENPLPASLELTLDASMQSPGAVAALTEQISGLAGVEGVQYSREWIGILKKMRSWFGWGTVAVVPFLILALHFMIANTIKLTIYARRDLVRNMRFVGATNLYIKMPFVLEGILQGMIGGVLGVTALLCVRFLVPDRAIYWGPPYVFLLIFLVGVIFGWIGSMSAVRKFLQ